MSEQIKSITQYSIVDLFAGAGGLSYGFLQTKRFLIKAAFELNANARRTYKRNHGDKVVMYRDVQDALSDKIRTDLGQVDVVIGGPPCQGFSSANRQKNHAISLNNSLVKKYVQAVLNLNPKAFIMENVSMLQSDVHRFYVDENDQTMITQYGISTAPAEILLLDEPFLFNGVADIVKSRMEIQKYLWDEKDYFVLNVAYKMRKNREKLKKALEKHRKHLINLAENLSKHRGQNEHIMFSNKCAGDAISLYYANSETDESETVLCCAIENAIVIQRMLSKAKEILDNHIIVTDYVIDHGLVAKVTSMAVIDYIESILSSECNGYTIKKNILSAAAFGAPQKRMRFVIMGVKKEIAANICLPVGTFTEANFRTVEDAIKDIEGVQESTRVKEGDDGVPLTQSQEPLSELGLQLRNSKVLYNHVTTATTPDALERFKAIPQGGNFHSLPAELKTTYSDSARTQNTIYLRLKYNEPSGTVVNVRKSMWIHPVHHRALSIREAARLQTFPDSFVFCGSKDSQYQQVGNAVPPILAKALAEHLCGYLDG